MEKGAIMFVLFIMEEGEVFRMTYSEIVKEAKKAVKAIDAKAIAEHTAIEIDITGEGQGAFYVELEKGRVDVEPYEYYDRDCLIRTDADTLSALFKGDLDANKAIAEQKIIVEGNADKAAVLANAFRKKPAPRIAAKKKESAPKLTTKKTEPKKITKKADPKKITKK